MDSSLKFIGLWFSIIRVYGFICLQWLQPFALWWNIVCTESIKFPRQDSNGGAAAIWRGKSLQRLALRKAAVLWHEELLYWWSPLLPVHQAICYQARLDISGRHWGELFGYWCCLPSFQRALTASVPCVCRAPATHVATKGHQAGPHWAPWSRWCEASRKSQPGRSSGFTWTPTIDTCTIPIKACQVNGGSPIPFQVKSNT